MATTKLHELIAKEQSSLVIKTAITEITDAIPRGRNAYAKTRKYHEVNNDETWRVRLVVVECALASIEEGGDSPQLRMAISDWMDTIGIEMSNLIGAPTTGWPNSLVEWMAVELGEPSPLPTLTFGA